MTSLPPAVPAASSADANNFNALRLFAAASVILHHAYDLTDRSGYLDGTTKVSIGWAAVSVFFSMSGYLIFLSSERSRSVVSFMAARCLRIFPGLFVMLVVTTLFLGFASSSLSISEFFSSSSTYTYVLGNLFLYVPKYNLPGVFSENYIHAVNGSLWTLRFEFTCYIAVAGCMLFGLTRRRKVMSLLMVLAGVIFLVGIVWASLSGGKDLLFKDGGDPQKLFRLGFAFYIGAAIAHFRLYGRINKWVSLGGLVLVICAYRTDYYYPSVCISLALWACWLSKIDGFIPVKLRSLPDFSYGLYIYSFPIQQFLIQSKIGVGIIENSVISLFFATVISLVSWLLIEKPALKFKRIFN